MAQVIGKSGAWDSVLRELNVAGFKPEKISNISKILETEMEKYKKEKEAAAQTLQNNAETLAKELKLLQQNYDEFVQDCKKNISTKIEFASLEIELLQN